LIWRMIADPVKRVLIFLTVAFFVGMTIHFYFEARRLSVVAEYYKNKYEDCAEYFTETKGG